MFCVRVCLRQLQQLGMHQVWDAAKDYTAVAKKTGGSFPGAIYQESRRWIGKAGSYDENTTSLNSIGSVERRGFNRDAIKEKIGADCYKALGDSAMDSSFNTPQCKLTLLPILNAFTCQDELAIAMDRKVQSRDGTVVHVLSQMVPAYHDLCEAKVLYRGSEFRSLEAHFKDEKVHIPTEIKTTDGRVMPLRGLIALLAASRLLMDIDVLGDSLKNAGYTVQADSKGHSYAQVVKVDPGFVFSFIAPQNLLPATRFPNPNPRRRERKMSDAKDVQAGSNGVLVIKWAQFSETQQDRFREYMRRGISLLRQPGVLAYLLARDGVFNSGAGELLLRPELIEKYTNFINENLDDQEEIYGL